MEMVLQDLRYALRALRKSPLFSVVAVLTLALGIGANATIFTWLEGMVLRPLPVVRDYDRLVLVITRGPQNARWSFSIPDWQDVARAATLIDGPAITNSVPLSVRSGEQAERAWGEVVSANYFDVLGVRPILGRAFVPAEDSALGAHPAAVLSNAYWRRKFAADSHIIGRAISVNGHPVTVVGVMPPRFGGKTAGVAFDLWLPLSMVGVATGTPNQYTARNWQTFDAFARLKPGVTFAQANAEMRTIGRQLATTYVHEDGNTGRELLPMGEDFVQAMFRPALAAVFGITGVVLLIACANIANLLLARGAARRREMGIRLALGARRGALVRQLLAESFVIALAGGALGLLVASWGSGLLTAFLPPVAYPVNFDLQLDVRVLLFALAVTVGTVILFGTVPALHASRPDLVSSLKDGSAAGGRSRGYLRGSLVVAQIALSVVALAAAGLFLRSLRAGERTDTGFRAPDQVLLVSTDLFLAGYTPSTGRVAAQQLLERIGSLPGVTAASFSTRVPLGFGGNNASGAFIEGYTPQKDENTAIQNDDIGPGYFAMIGTPIIAGREFTAQDDSAAMHVAVVNEAFAKRYWPGQDPLGRWIEFGNSGKRIVVGVAATAKYQRLDEKPLPFVFLPFAQDYSANLALYVRAGGDPKRLAEPIRRTMAGFDPNLPCIIVGTFAEHMGAAVYLMRIGAVMLALFGALALVLSTMGIYSVVAYSVSQRTRELGIRTALGAARRDILALVLGQGMRLAALGVVVGTFGAFGVGKLLSSQLLGVSAGDPLTLAGTAALLGSVALFATWLPARRAARVDPVVALRTE